ncbi:histidine triad nucleotide-binding protein [Ruminococcaceae bacterium OttesenSCG-928-L11]|nr:histidine triad nucleotide-binding protein [Ruminococcaceae bacterium OttesenSCG-928-L11]
MDCLFCKIIAGEIPSTKVYEDDVIFAFLDIDPKAPEHIVIIPKAHIPSADAVTADNCGDIGHLFSKIPEIAGARGLTNGYRVVNNCGEDGGQTVGHIHFHLLGGRQLAWPPG